MLDSGLPVAPVHVGDDALETVSADDLVAPVVDIAEVDAFVSRAVQDRVPVRLLLPLVGHLDIESVVPGERLEHVEVVHVSSVPTPNRSFRKGRLRVGDHQVGVEVLLDAQPIAGLAGARRVVEGEHARLEFTNAVATFRAGETGAEGQIRAVLGIEEADHGDVFAEVQRGLERLARRCWASRGPEPVHDGFDGVLLVLVEVGGMVEIRDDAVDASRNEAVGGEFREHVLVLSLRSRITGARTMILKPSGTAMTWSTIWLTVCASRGRPCSGSGARRPARTGAGDSRRSR